MGPLRSLLVHCVSHGMGDADVKKVKLTHNRDLI
jgi:hypothetical protein